MVFIIDQASKLTAIKMLTYNNSIPVIKNIFFITLIKNKGAAFGILQGRQIFFIFVSIILFALIFYFVAKLPKRDIFSRFTLGLVFGGSMGNLFDRVFRAGVVDFFDLRYFSVFNIADIMINTGAFLFLLGVLIKYRKDVREGQNASYTI